MSTKLMFGKLKYPHIPEDALLEFIDIVSALGEPIDVLYSGKNNRLVLRYDTMEICIFVKCPVIYSRYSLSGYGLIDKLEELIKHAKKC